MRENVKFSCLIVDKLYNKLTNINTTLNFEDNKIYFVSDNEFFTTSGLDCLYQGNNINKFFCCLFKSYLSLCNQDVFEIIIKNVIKYIEENNIKFIYDNRNTILNGIYTIDNNFTFYKPGVKLFISPEPIIGKTQRIVYNLSEFLTMISYLYFYVKSDENKDNKKFSSFNDYIFNLDEYQYIFIPYDGNIESKDEFIDRLKKLSVQIKNF